MQTQAYSPANYSTCKHPIPVSLFYNSWTRHMLFQQVRCLWFNYRRILCKLMWELRPGPHVPLYTPEEILIYIHYRRQPSHIFRCVLKLEYILLYHFDLIVSSHWHSPPFPAPSSCQEITSVKALHQLKTYIASTNALPVSDKEFFQN